MASLELKLIVDAETGIAKIRSFGDAVQGSAQKQKTAWDEVKSSLTALGQLYVLDKGLEFLKSSVEEYANAEKAAVKLDAVLRSTHGAAGLSAQAMKDYASQLQDTTAYEDDAIVNAEAMLATFTKINDPGIFKAAISSALNLATVMDGDVKGAVIQLGKALNDPSEGLLALRKSGISFTQSQIGMIKSLQESGDLLGAQKIILAEVKTEMGGTAEAAGNVFGGQMSRLKNEVGNAKEAIGSLTADALKPSIPQWTLAAQGLADYLENLKGINKESQTDRIGKDFAENTKAIYAAKQEVEKLKEAYGAAATSSWQYNAAAAKLAELEKQRSGLLGMNAVVVKQTAAAEKKESDERVARLKKEAAAEAEARDEKTIKEYGDLAKKTLAEIGTEEDKLIQKYLLEVDKIKSSKKDSLAVQKAAADARYALDQKLLQDLGVVWKKDADERIKQHEELNKLLAASDESWLNDREKSAYKYLADADKINAMELVSADEKNRALLQLETDHKARIFNIDQKDMEERGKLQLQFKHNTTQQLLEILQAKKATTQEEIAIRDELVRRDNNYFTSFKDNLFQAAGANKTFYDQMGEMGAAVGSALKGTFTSVYEDALNGNLDNAQKYVDAFRAAAVRAAANFAAEWTAAYIATAYAAESAATAQESAAATAALANKTAALATAAAWAAATLGITLAIYEIIIHWEEFKKSFTSTAVGIGDGVATLINLPLGVTLITIKAMVEALKWVKDLMTSVWDSGPMKVIRDMIQSIADAIKTITDALGSIGVMPGIGGGGGGGGVVGTVINTAVDIGHKIVDPGSWFAGGGIMTSSGPLPLHTYSTGGIADSPQIAIFGEGRMNEAYVPLPNGNSIPVELKIPPAPRSGQASMPLIINIGAKKLEDLIVELTWTLSESGVMLIHPRAVRSYAQ